MNMYTGILSYKICIFHTQLVKHFHCHYTYKRKLNIISTVVDRYMVST